MRACGPTGRARGAGTERLSQTAQPRADLIRKHPFLLICSGRSPHTPGENRCFLSPNEHLGLRKWLHSALFRREKRILWLQTTLSVNILQLSAHLSDDKPHAARRAANLRPYGYHFIVIFHGRNVNVRCLLHPPLPALLSELTRRLLSPQARGTELRPGPPWPGCPEGGRKEQIAPSHQRFNFHFLITSRNPATSPRIRGSKQGCGAGDCQPPWPGPSGRPSLLRPCRLPGGLRGRLKGPGLWLAEQVTGVIGPAVWS